MTIREDINEAIRLCRDGTNGYAIARLENALRDLDNAEHSQHIPFAPIYALVPDPVAAATPLDPENPRHRTFRDGGGMNPPSGT